MTGAEQERLATALGRAIEQQQLHMLYQPKVRLLDGSLAGVEALVRWADPELGPDRAVAVHSGGRGAWPHPRTHPVGTADDPEAMGRLARSGVDTVIAFNISAFSLQHLDFPDLVEQMCHGLEVPSDRLVLELTEGATQPLVKLMDTLTRFRIKGIGLAIDDFGPATRPSCSCANCPSPRSRSTGPSSRTSPHSRDCRLIVGSIADLAHGLGLIGRRRGSRPSSSFESFASSGATSSRAT